MTEEYNALDEETIIGAIDEHTQYMHVIVASGNDQCSEARLKDVINLNQLLKSNIKNYKLACI